jgi:excisionase family DNA binding protein
MGKGWMIFFGWLTERLQVSLSFAYTMMQRGDIPTVRLGRAVRVRPEDLEEFIRSNVRGLNSKPS